MQEIKSCENSQLIRGLQRNSHSLPLILNCLDFTPNSNYFAIQKTFITYQYSQFIRAQFSTENLTTIYLQLLFQEHPSMFVSCFFSENRFDIIMNNKIESQEKTEEPTLPVTDIQPEKYVKSEHKEQYLRMMELSSISEIQKTKEAVINKLTNKGVILNESRTFFQLSFRIVSHTPNYECLILKACLSRFTFFVSVIFVKEVSCTHAIKTCFSGTFSTVYRAKILDKQVAIKCNICSSQSFLSKFYQTLSQYLAFRIASELEIGPKMEKSLGFDIIAYENCIEFSMEYCQRNMQKYQYSLKSDLTDCLKVLHSLNIIHFDIKPDNICYSQQHKKSVFIDYGLHKIIKEEVGLKSITRFRGTLVYSSSQMGECCQAHDTRYIDLYFNDAHCLMVSIEEIQKSEETFLEADFVKSLTPHALIFLFKAALVEMSYISNIDRFYLNQLRRQLHIYTSKAQIEEGFNFEKMLKSSYIVNFKSKKQKNEHHEIKSLLFEQKNQIVEKQYYELRKQRHFKMRKEMVQTVREIDTTQLFILYGSYSAFEYDKLKDVNACQNLDLPLHISLLAKYLQILNTKINPKDKMLMCKNFNILHLQIPSFDQLEGLQQLQISFRYFIEYVLNRNFLEDIQLQVLKYSFLTLIILQAYSIDQLKKILQRIVQIPASFLKKIRLFLFIFSSLEWISWTFISKYSYFTFMDFAYASCKKYLSSFQGVIHSEQKQIMAYMKLLTLNLQQKIDLNLIKKQFKVKFYLYHAMTNDYSKVLVEVYMLAVFRILKKQQSMLSIQITDHFYNLQELTYYEEAFNFQEPYLVIVLQTYSYISAITLSSSTYITKRPTFFVGSRNINKCLPFNDGIWSNQDKKQHPLMSELKELQVNFSDANSHYLFMYLKKNIYYLQKKKRDNKTSVSLLKEKAERIKLLIPKCFEVISQEYKHFHQHNKAFQILTIIEIIRILHAVFDVCSNQQIEAYFCDLYRKIQQFQCIQCKLQCLNYFTLYHLFRIHNPKMFSRMANSQVRISSSSEAEEKVSPLIEQHFISSFLSLQRAKYSLRFLCKYMSQYLHLINHNAYFPHGLPPFKYNYVLLIYEAAKSINKIELYFILGQNNKLVPCFEQICLTLWMQSDSHSQYFQYIAQMCNSFSKRFFSKKHLVNFYLQVRRFIFRIPNQFRGVFFQLNFTYFFNIIRRHKNQVLATYLSFILLTKPVKFKADTLYFLHIWSFCDQRIEYARQIPYYVYICSNPDINIRKSNFLKLKAFRQSMLAKSEIINPIKKRIKNPNTRHRELFLTCINRIHEINQTIQQNNLAQKYFNDFSQSQF